MILAVDIGNTTIQFAFVDKGKVKRLQSIDACLPVSELKKSLRSLCRIFKRQKQITECVICSVVPKISGSVKRVLRKELAWDVFIIGDDIKVPMEIDYRPKTAVGQDRLVGAFAAKEIYGTPSIIIDLGTAITFDMVSECGVYDGGIIIPGIRLSAESLFNKTALLPNIDAIKAPKTLVGKSTKESILSGLFNGYGTMCSGLIDQLKVKKYKNARIVVTGGHVQLMKKYISSRINKIDEDLVFKGLYLLQRN